MKILDLIHRSNVDVFHFGDIPVVIYEDHRYILNVLHALRLSEEVSPPYNLVYFDFHDDALKPIKEQVELIKKMRSSTPTLEEFWQFVEFRLRSLDDDWLLSGMELGLIKDAILIGGKDTDNLSNIKQGYTDHYGDIHYVYEMSHLWHSLDLRGQLGDSMIKDSSYTNIRNIIGYNTEGCYSDFTASKPHPYILDFDCDVFSTDILEQTKAWPRKRMFELFNEYISPFHGTSADFVRKLMERAEVITICRESGCCGGYQESAKILQNMNELFFDGVIK